MDGLPGPSPLTARSLSSYGGLRLPLALLELPLFVLLPALYGQHLGLPLAVLGAVLFAARLLDAVTDPLIGTVLDRTRQRISPATWILIASPLMFLGFAALLNPPRLSTGGLAAWLAIASVLTYLGWSVVTITHQAWGAALASDDPTRVRVTGWREAFGLAGVLMSALLLDPARVDALLVLFAVALLVGLALIRRAPRPTIVAGPQPNAHGGWFGQVSAPLAADPGFRRLLAVFMLNGTATAIPATLVLFYVADVLQAPGQAPFFLLLYFIAGAVGMPVWVAAGARLGLARAWLVGMLAAMAAFVWAFALGAGDTAAFAVICVLSGLALGADLALPGALLARHISAIGGAGLKEGAYFGLWSLATKLNLAIAAGAGLSALQGLGYTPGAGGPTLALSLAYAALPCLLKLASGLLLFTTTGMSLRPSRMEKSL